MENTGYLAVVVGMLGIALVVAFVVWIISCIGMMKMFMKAGEPGWYAFVPIFSVYKLAVIAGAGDVFIWTFCISMGMSVIGGVISVIPFIGGILCFIIQIGVFALYVVVYKSVCSAYGMEGWGPAILMAFFFVIMTLVLGFGSYTYTKPYNEVLFKDVMEDVKKKF